MHENSCGKLHIAVLHLKGDENSLFQSRTIRVSIPKLTDDRRAREGPEDLMRPDTVSVASQRSPMKNLEMTDLRKF